MSPHHEQAATDKTVLTLDQLVLHPTFIVTTASTLIETDFAGTLPWGRGLLAILLLAVCLLVTHGGGYLILRKREEIMIRTRLAVQRVLPEAKLDEGLGFCDESLRDEFLESISCWRIGHDIYSAILGGGFALIDGFTFRQPGQQADLSQWLWPAVAAVVLANHIARIFISRRDPATTNVLTAVHVISHGACAFFALMHRMQDLGGKICLLPLAAVLTSSWLPYGASSESGVAMAWHSGAFSVAHCAACFMLWDKAMPWTQWLHPGSLPESVFMPVFVIPIFVASCISATLRLWAHSMMVTHFAIKQSLVT